MTSQTEEIFNNFNQPLMSPRSYNIEFNYNPIPKQTSKRKPKKIFKISKVEKKVKFHKLNNKKNEFSINKEFYQTNDEINNLNNIQDREKLENINSSNLNQCSGENDEEESLNICNNNPNSLISISKEVYCYLKKMKNSKGSSVTEYILQNLKTSQGSLSFKNIQRRVYDAINVMNAVGIIFKQKNNLHFKGRIKLKSPNLESKHNFKSRIIKEKTKNIASSINSKQYELIGLCAKVLFFKIVICL